jgi:lysozyme
MSYTLGIDVSHWQDNNNTPARVDFAKARAAGAQFIFIKASQNTYPDEDFAYNWQAAKAAGLLRGAYHFYDYRYRADKQAEYLWSLIADDPGELPPVLDVEPFWQPVPGRLALLAGLRDFFNVIDRLAGRKCLLYSNPATLLSFKPLPIWVLEHPLWVAHYGVAKPNPCGWIKWHFWQYTDRLDGAAYGMESKQLDGNYYSGTLDELRAWAGVDTQPPPALTLEQRVARIEQHLGLA